jgi:hypothetical protein
MQRIVRGRRVTWPVAVAAVVLFVGGCVTSPAQAAREAQQMNDLSDALNEVRSENAQLAATLDSVTTVLAKHDTTLSRIANVTGIVVAK